MTALRTTCVLCCLKHVGQARALWLEAQKGYPNFHWFCIGHLAEAEDEIVQEYPGLADKIRTERKVLEGNPRYRPEFESLVEEVSKSTGYDVSTVLGEVS